MDSNTPTEETGYHIGKAGYNGDKGQACCPDASSWLLWLVARLTRRGANV
jgi:hypothetical protein